MNYPDECVSKLKDILILLGWKNPDEVAISKAGEFGHFVITRETLIINEDKVKAVCGLFCLLDYRFLKAGMSPYAADHKASNVIYLGEAADSYEDVYLYLVKLENTLKQ